MIPYQFDKDKANTALLYISREISDADGMSDKYAALKILYFAEKKHLVEFGRLITNDRFAALKFGPVPSSSYDLLDYGASFTQIDNKKVIPNEEPNLKKLSKSDILCLDESIKENKELTFGELKKKSHDKAYHNAFDNGIQWLSIEDIAIQEGAEPSLVGYIKEYYQAVNLSKCLTN